MRSTPLRERLRALVRFERDERIAKIVSGWPQALEAGRARSLGLEPERCFEDIVRQYIAEFRPQR